MDEQTPDFKIAYDGTWFHNGAPIQRAALAKLFSDKALKIDENGRFWLATPFEKYPVEVKDVPYVIIDYEARTREIDLRTNMDEIVPLGPDHKLELRGGIPYVEVRKGLYARLGRAVYYNMVEAFGASVTSRGVEHPLGTMEENDERSENG